MLAGLLLGCNLPAALRPHVLITQAQRHPVRKNMECFCSRGLSLTQCCFYCVSQRQKVGACACGGGAAGLAVHRISLFCRKYIQFQFSTAAAIERSLGRGGVSNSRECERELSLCFAFRHWYEFCLLLYCALWSQFLLSHCILRSSTNIARSKIMLCSKREVLAWHF